ncbi:MAG: GNAT family N-acetyltransferase [Pseudomonadota bacterium]
MSDVEFRELVIEDHGNIIELFKRTPGITIREADNLAVTEGYLVRNPGLSFVATFDSSLIGCVMCGHDGRRGYLQHLVVDEEYRGQGVGSELVSRCIDTLKRIGIAKTHIFVLQSNQLANAFWAEKGWQLRHELNMYSYNSSSDANA